MEEIENYIKQHSDNHLYPAFSIKIDNQWYMGVGNLNSAGLADYFLGRYSNRCFLPKELENIVECSKMVNRCNEKLATNEIYILFEPKDICEANLGRRHSPDRRIWRG